MKYLFSFKPCYKWNTFNTDIQVVMLMNFGGFKPCYKWNTFNTELAKELDNKVSVWF